jgi:formylglycine-generating enzyme required for sulfatase activity
MGSGRDRAARPDEMPQLKIDLPAFAIGKYPVTVAEFDCALRAGAVKESSAFNSDVT